MKSRFKAILLRKDADKQTALDVELTPDDLREVEGAASRIAIQGDRYPEELERRTGK